MATNPNSVLNRQMFEAPRVASPRGLDQPVPRIPALNVSPQGIAPMGAGAMQQATVGEPVQLASSSAPPVRAAPPAPAPAAAADEDPEQFVSSYADDGMPNISSENIVPYIKAWGLPITPDEEQFLQSFEGQTKSLTEWKNIAAARPGDVDTSEGAEQEGLGQKPFDNLENVLNTTSGQTRAFTAAAETMKGSVGATPEQTAADPAAGGIEAIFAKSLNDTPIKTSEEYNEEAKKILGAEGEKDVPDWALPLMQFGLTLMATPGPVTQAIGIAGQKALPTFAAARKEKRIRKKEQGLLAYKLRAADVASRKSTRVALAKHISGNQKLAVNLYGKMGDEVHNMLQSIPEYARGIAANELESRSYKDVLNLVKGGNIDLAVEGGKNSVQLAIASAVRKNLLKESDLGGFQNRGWQTIVEYSQDGKSQRTVMVATKSVGGLEADKEKGIGPGGLAEKRTVTPWAPRTQATSTSMVMTVDDKGQVRMQQFTGTADELAASLEKNDAKDIAAQQASTLSLIYKGEQVIDLLDRVGIAGTMTPTKQMAGLVQGIGEFVKQWGIADPETVKAAQDEFVRVFYGKPPKEAGGGPSFAESIGESSREDHQIKRGPDSGIWLGGVRRSSRQAAFTHIKGLDPTSAQRIIASGDDDGDPDTTFRTQEDKDAFIKFSSANAKMKSLLYDMAYSVAQAAESGGRLTDRDVANALTQLGYNNSPFVSAEIFKEVLTSKINNVVADHRARMLQAHAVSRPTQAERLNALANPKFFYSVKDPYETLYPGSKLPNWIRTGRSAEESEAEPAAGPPPAIVESEPGMSGVDVSSALIRNAVVNSPVFSSVDEPDKKVNLKTAFPKFILDELINKQGTFRYKDTVSLLEAITENNKDSQEALKLFNEKIMRETRLPLSEAKKLGVKIMKNLEKLYEQDLRGAQDEFTEGPFKEFMTGVY
tara:strand:- start:15008 stop:17824 length:2817 start_codon:yes stop_codon:yes gene_type:complete